VPSPPFEHLIRMSDTTGLHEHACGTEPRLEHGYCLDDNARALVVACRQRPTEAAVDRLIETSFRFVTRAQAADGTCHNRLDRAGRWTDEPTTGDWWGRALWALGTAVARCTQPWIRATAVARFDRSARLRSADLHAMAFASLGAAEVLSVHPGHQASRDLLAAAAATIGRPDFSSAWPWPEHRLRYANAAIPEALIIAGWWLGDEAVLTDGLHLLEWLLGVETLDGHLSVTPAGGWSPPEPRPAFDQQPLEVAAIADACGRALQITGDPRWSAGLDLTVGWFLGNNDRRILMYDPSTGGGFDALTTAGVNTNQGAESTLAMVATLQHGREPALLGA
jgi:hypothetical protein